MLNDQMSLFGNGTIPLAERMRPQFLQDFIGQESVVGEGSILKKEIMEDKLSSMILWGPPGCGKTTLVQIIFSLTHTTLYKLSAISAGVKEIKEILKVGSDNHVKGLNTILFIDEIHRLNKSQQDVLLADVENGNIILIGATTENPSFELNRALLSRVRVIIFNTLTDENIYQLLVKAIEKDAEIRESGVKLTDNCLLKIAVSSGGDARSALNMLETAINHYRNDSTDVYITSNDIRELLSANIMVYDKKSDEHYQVISALHKSMRNSDPDAAVYWLARMLEAGEDPLFIARRLIRFASEDIGLACNNALQVAVAAYQAVHYIGMPECTLSLTQAVIYFSVLPKSNSLYKAYEKAKSVAKETSNISVPLHLRNASTKLMAQLNYGKGYQYAHDYEGVITNMECLPEQLKDIVFYHPRTEGNEKKVKEYLESIKIKKNNIG